MFRKRRRKFKGTWLPILGEFNDPGGDDHDVVPLKIDIPGAGKHTTWVAPLVYDVPQDDDAANPLTSGLNSIIGNEYALRRIVGKLFLARLSLNDTQPDDGDALLVGAGFFIARTDTSTAAGADIPVGATTAFTATANAQQRNLFSPLDMSTTREPWIWRRTWALGSNAHTQTAAAIIRGAGSFSTANSVNFASSLDGPHIDAKTRRTVRQEERLFLSISFCKLLSRGLGTDLTGETITGCLDLRVFGQIRRARQRGSFD